MKIDRITEGDLTAEFPQLWNRLAETVEQQDLAIDAYTHATRKMFAEATSQTRDVDKRVRVITARLSELESDVFAAKWTLAAGVIGAYLIGLFT